MLGEEISSGANMPIVEDMIEGAMPSHLSSEDKALVIYKPVNKPTLFGLSIANPSIIVSSDLIRGLKSKSIMIKLLLYLYLSSYTCLLFIMLQYSHCACLTCPGYQMSCITAVIVLTFCKHDGSVTFTR